MFPATQSHQFEHFSLRQCAAVIGLFGIITIISYFNELAKLGMLGDHVYARAAPPASSASPMLTSTSVMMQGDQLQGLDVQELKSVLRSNTTRRNRSTNDVLSISLHLDKHKSYIKANRTQVQVFKHQNAMPNYYTSITVTGTTFCVYNCTLLRSPTEPPKPSEAINSSRPVTSRPNPSIVNDTHRREFAELNSNLRHNSTIMSSSITDFIMHQKLYAVAAKVFLYQHELAGYSMRDCFKSKSQEAGLNLLTSPINHNYRSEWEMFSANKRARFDALFGGYAFGVCETLNKPCMYFSMVTHPLDRILQVYHYCRKSSVNNLCSFSHSNLTERDLSSFIKNSGNTYFKKLLYYSKHCKLLGKDQVCIQDSKTYFILSPSERKVLLDDILSNLDKWFAVIGLVDHYKDSLKLFEHVLSLNFTKCDAFNHTSIGKYLPAGADFSFLNESRKIHRSIKATRQKLLKDPKVVSWISADLAIYDKMQEIYYKQWAVYQQLKSLNLTGKHLARTKSKLYSHTQGKHPPKTDSVPIIELNSTTLNHGESVYYQAFDKMESHATSAVSPHKDKRARPRYYSLKERLRQSKLTSKHKHRFDTNPGLIQTDGIGINRNSDREAKTNELLSLLGKRGSDRETNFNKSPQNKQNGENIQFSGPVEEWRNNAQNVQSRYEDSNENVDLYDSHKYDYYDDRDFPANERSRDRENEPRDLQSEPRDMKEPLRLADAILNHKMARQSYNYANYEDGYANRVNMYANDVNKMARQSNVYANDVNKPGLREREDMKDKKQYLDRYYDDQRGFYYDERR